MGQLARELHPQHGRLGEISLSAAGEELLGIDSLGRTELVLRLERAFGARLPIGLVAEADTVGDLLRVLEQARSPTIVAAPLAPSLAAVPAAGEARTLLEVLEWHVARNSDRLHVTVLEDESDRHRHHVLWRACDHAAKAVAPGLIERDMAGDRVALMLPTGTEFFAAFFGILYAGAVPVPIYPPMQLSQLEDYLRRQANILCNAAPRVLVTVTAALRLGALLRGLVPSLSAIKSVGDLQSGSAHLALPRLNDPDATALIQYTSGSTGDPKGVVLLMPMCWPIFAPYLKQSMPHAPTFFLSWLPLYHDMGLIGAWLGPLYAGASCYVMSPLSFLAHPQSWLWASHRTGPLFRPRRTSHLSYVSSKIDDADLAGLDLSSLRFVANGAEPVSVHTLRQFIERIQPI